MMLLVDIVIGIAVCAGAAIDLRTGLLPDRITLGALALVVALATSHGEGVASITGAITTAAPMWLLHAASRGRALGFGDVKLAAAIGAALGASGGLVALGVAFCTGALVGIALLVARRARRGDAVAFGPYLACGTLATLAARIGGLV